MVVMSATESPVIFSVCGMCYGISLGTMPLLQDEVVRRVPAENRGKGTSTLFIGQDIAMGVGTFLWGWLIDVFGFFTASILSGAIIIVSAAMLAAFLRKNPHVSRVK